jgi:hypothetical protein
MNKKADVNILAYFTTKLVIIVIMAIIILQILGSAEVILNTNSIVNMIMVSRLIYSKDLFAYADIETGRVYPGLIDISKFNDETLASGIKNSNNRLAAIIELKDIDTDIVKTLYINENKAKAWEDYEEVSDFDTSLSRRYVRIYDNGNIHKGLIKIKVIINE